MLVAAMVDCCLLGERSMNLERGFSAMNERDPTTAFYLLFTDANIRDEDTIGGYIMRPANNKKTRYEDIESFSRPASQTGIDLMEYEALIEGLTLARDLRIERIWAYTDRRSIFEQYYQCPRKPAKSSHVSLETVVSLKESFKAFGMSWIPRAANVRADLLGRPDS
jgi:ribonuclease HI